MGVAQVVVNGTTRLDLTNDTVSTSNLLSGYTATGADGDPVTGALILPTFTTQSKTVTPTDSTQVITPDEGYDGLSSVTVGAGAQYPSATGVSF